MAKLKPQLHRLADDYAHLSQFTHATVLSAGSWASGAKILFATAFVERFIEQHFLSIFAELIDIHLNIINLIVKLAQVLNIEVDSGIFELVKLLEKDVNNLKETIDAFLELALKDETPTMESPGGI